MMARHRQRMVIGGCVMVWLFTFAGCPSGYDRVEIGGDIPADPSHVDPPIQVTAEQGGTIDVDLTGVSSGTPLDVYINGSFSMTVTAGAGSVTIPLPATLGPGNYALALTDAGTKNVRAVRVLVISNTPP